MQIKQGQVAVVTGAASGIGLAMVNAFADCGLRVAMLDVEQPALEREAAQLRERGVDVLAMVCDVADLTALEDSRDVVMEHFGQIDIVCSNAGVVVPFGPLWTCDANDWEWILDVNLRGAFNCLVTFTPLLVAQDSGHVVVTASMAGVSTITGNGPYNATKHGLVSLAETMEADLRAVKSQVGVTILCCGLVRTRIREAARNHPGQSFSPIDVPVAAQGASGAGHLEAGEVARQVLNAIRRDQLYLFTNPGSESRVLARVERLMADFQ